VHTAFGFVCSGTSFAHPKFAYWASGLKWDSTAGLTCGAVCDILIAVAMVYFLSAHRTAFANSRSLVNKLMLYSIESGALTSICALSTMITFLVSLCVAKGVSPYSMLTSMHQTVPNFVSLGLLMFWPKCMPFLPSQAS
jgi:hypothetical protein